MQGMQFKAYAFEWIMTMVLCKQTRAILIFIGFTHQSDRFDESNGKCLNLIIVTGINIMGLVITCVFN